MAAALMTTASVNVTTAATRVALVSNTTTCLVSEFEVQAKSANTGTIYLGTVAVSSSNGRQLAAGAAWSSAGLQDIGHKSANVQIDLATIYIDSSVNGEGVILTYLVR